MSYLRSAKERMRNDQVDRAKKQKTNLKIWTEKLNFYSVEFYKLNRKTFECPMVEECEIVYFDQLKRAIETVTGLFLSI